MNILKAYDSLMATGGATYNINTRELNPTSGFIVSLEGFEKIVDIPVDLNKFQDAVTSYLVSGNVLETLADEDNIYLGMWIHNDKLYLDVSERTQYWDEAFTKAILNNQISFYDADRKEVVYLNKVANDPDIETDKKY